MRPSRHLAVSTAAGAGVWAVSGEPLAVPVAIGAGVLVDIDHSPDLWWAYALRREPVSVIFFHSWEWLVALLLFGVWTGFQWWLVALVLGFGLHLSTDKGFNRVSLKSQSLIYRARHRFKASVLNPNLDLDGTYRVLEQEVRPAIWLIEWWRRRSRPETRDPG